MLWDNICVCIYIYNVPWYQLQQGNQLMQISSWFGHSWSRLHRSNYSSEWPNQSTLKQFISASKIFVMEWKGILVLSEGSALHYQEQMCFVGCHWWRGYFQAHKLWHIRLKAISLPRSSSMRPWGFQSCRLAQQQHYCISLCLLSTILLPCPPYFAPWSSYQII